MPTIGGAQLAELVDGSRAITVEFGRYASACTMLIEALGEHPFGAPLAWRKAVVAALDSRDIAVLAPFVTSHPLELPSCLCILPHRTRAGFAPLEDDLERIAAMPHEQLVDQLPPNDHWHEVARHPGRWLARFVQAVGRASAGLEDLWRHAAGLLDRETERVGVATARGAERELVATRFAAPVLQMTAPTPAGAEVRRPLGMVPLLAGPGATHAWMLQDRLSHIAYPIPGLEALLERRAPPDGLEALIGIQRTLILRHLDRPTFAGKLAELLIAVPSAVSHHLAILERAGLVYREREGWRVRVHRTARGTELLALYE
jgi:DNA-binding transcriptional ArsR family regulator